MITVGLTGGIGSGKSEVARILRRLGAAVVEADRLGHETYRRGGPVYKAVEQEFGPDILDADGNVDRRKLGRLVFASPERRRRLEAIVWPEIRRSISARLAEEKAGGARVAVLEAAVLLEAGWQDLVDHVWVVEAPEELVIERLRRRTGLPDDEIRVRMQSQLTAAERAQSATLRIVNDGDIASLEERVAAAWKALTAG